MTLYEKLKQARSEEDVKDAYIKALGLKGYSKNLIDIQTKEIWFEAKDGGKNSTYAMFTQLMHYVQEALNKGDYIPPFLCVIDAMRSGVGVSALEFDLNRLLDFIPTYRKTMEFRYWLHTADSVFVYELTRIYPQNSEILIAL
ncbi:MAG: hypothetical protein WCK78_00020 [Paludibacter sp.]